MKVPCCLVCQNEYDDEARCPLLLQCGHEFCRECVSKIFTASPGHAISCPQCRHVTTVGNSVSALRKNYEILSLIQEDDEDLEEDEVDGDDHDNNRNAHCKHLNFNGCSSSGCNINNACTVVSASNASRGNNLSSKIDLSVHREVKLVKKIEEENIGTNSGSRRHNNIEMWNGLALGGCCKHRVAVKKVSIDNRVNEDVIWMQGKLEELRRKSMWCQNVCTFHGVKRIENSLCLVMNRYRRSLQTEIQRNEGRLTLEQILRYGADIARGVAELHAAGVVCMNIKPSNLLLDDDGHALVSDYGLAQILKKPDCRKATEETRSSNIHSCIDCTMLSPNNTAPEAWDPVNKSLHRFWDDAIGISKESDAWSFGCTLVEMCTGSIPWAGLSHEEIYQSVVKSKRQPPQYAGVFGAGVPRELWKMIGECLQFKPSKRPTFHSILSMFLRHLQEIHRSPSTGRNDDVEIIPAIKRLVMPAPSDYSEVVYPPNPRVLRRLISEGKLDAIREMLASVASGDGYMSVRALLLAENEQGENILHLACQRGNVELVEAILESEEADVDAIDNNGDPPLAFALAAGSPECVRALVKHSAYVRSRLRQGLGPSLVHACAYYNGQPDCVRELLMAGADPNSIEDEGESALHRAVANKFTECAIVILENGGCSSMGILNHKHLTPLHLCVETWNVDVVKRWLELASEEDIAKAINIVSPMGTALSMAASAKKHHQSDKIKGRELARMLLAAGADPAAQEAEHQTVLNIAATANDAELVKIILEAGVDVNISNIQNVTALHIALANGAKSCVDLLLSAGANCNLQDDDGHTAFHVAAATAELMRENMQCLVAMLSYPNAAIDVRDHSGETLKDYLEAFPREYIPEDLIEALAEKGVHLSKTFYRAGDWVRYRRSISTPSCGWNGATHETISFVQEVPDSEHLILSSCSGKAKVLQAEVVKVIPMERGHHVQLKPDVIEPRFGSHDQPRDSIGIILYHDIDGVVYVEFPGADRPWKADPAEIRRAKEFEVGDWARVRPKHDLSSITPGSIGVVSSIGPDHSLCLELSYSKAPWKCEPEDLERVEPLKIGDRVCVKRSVAHPRFGWGDETHHSVGTIKEIENNGRLTVEFPHRPPTSWEADPSDMEKLQDFEIGDWVRVKPSVPFPKYGWDDVTRNSIGIIHSFEEEGEIGLAFCFRSKLFSCSMADVEKVPPFELGQDIRLLPSLSQPRLGWPDGSPSSVGKIARIDMDGTLNVKVPGMRSLWRVSPGDAEQPPEFKAGDWVRIKPSNARSHARKQIIAVVRSVPNNGHLELASAFYGGGARWVAHHNEVERVPGFKVGQLVKFRSGLGQSNRAMSNARGFVVSTNNSAEVGVKFDGSERLHLGDPADLEHEPMFEVAEWVRLKEGASDWRSVGPGSIGVVQGLVFENDEWDGNVLVGFCGEQEPWSGSTLDLERVDRLRIGQRVRVKNSVERPRFGWSGHSYASVGTITSVDADGKLRMGPRGWALDPSEVEAVEEERELRVGDWVRVRPSVSDPTHQWGDVPRSSVGVVHLVGDKDDDDLWVAFCFTEQLWLCKDREMERVRPFKVGDKVRIRDGLVMPRWDWRMETPASRGVVVGVDANGKLRIKFRWREGRTWIGDPADIVLHET